MSTPKDGIYPLFPLDLVLYPGMPLPLHIFEPRYQEMIQECLAHNKEFGVILSHNGRLSQVGTLAKIENVLEQFPDGRMNILCLGKTKFSLEELLEGRSFHQGKIVLLEDLPEDPSVLSSQRKKGEDLLEEFSRFTGAQGRPEFFSSFSCGNFSYLLSELTGLSQLRQQEILELPSASMRYERVLEAMERIVAKHRMFTDLHEVLGPEADVTQILN